MPVLGSGHPQADVFLLKHAPTVAEIEEGVAFYGRSGTALMKSLKRLGIDPLAVYGTLCVKCPVADTALADPACVARSSRSSPSSSPDRRGDGPEALDVLNELDMPLARPVAAQPGLRAADPLDRRAVRPEHRRLPRRGSRQARVLVGVQGARRVVRGSSALLIAGALATMYLVAAPALPRWDADIDTVRAVEAAVSAAAVTVVAALIAPLVLERLPFAVGTAVAGAAMLAAALAGASSGATLWEAAFWCCLGLAFARWTVTPAMAVAAPLVVGLVDLLLGAGQLPGGGGGDVLELSFAAWGGGEVVALPALVVVLLGAVLGWALLLGWRWWPLLAVLPAGVAWEVDANSARPLALLLAVVFLLTNIPKLLTYR